MTELRIGDQLLEFERDATIVASSQVPRGDADRCTCAGCHNFSLLRDKIYPESFRALLTTLGIDSNKEGEAVHYGPKGDSHLYGGWFYFVGKLIEAGERNSKIGTDFEFFITTAFPQPPQVFGNSVAAVEFTTLLPWILEETWNASTDAGVAKVEEIIKRYPKTLQDLSRSE